MPRTAPSYSLRTLALLVGVEFEAEPHEAAVLLRFLRWLKERERNKPAVTAGKEGGNAIRADHHRRALASSGTHLQ